MESPRTRYARSVDGTYIAYQVFGDGPDLLLAPAWISHLELSWELDELGRWLRALGRFARVMIPYGFEDAGWVAVRRRTLVLWPD